MVEYYNSLPPWIVRVSVAIIVAVLVAIVFFMVSMIKRIKSENTGYPGYKRRVFRDRKQVAVKERMMELVQIKDNVKARILDAERVLKSLNEDLKAIERTLGIQGELSGIPLESEEEDPEEVPEEVDTSPKKLDSKDLPKPFVR